MNSPSVLSSHNPSGVSCPEWPDCDCDWEGELCDQNSGEGAAAPCLSVGGRSKPIQLKETEA